jgi:Rieske Fe-S protein
MYICNLCNYTTNLNHDYKKHLITQKHLKSVLCDKILIESKNNQIACQYCNKKYKYTTYLNKHEAKCKIINSTDINMIKYNYEQKLKFQELKYKNKLLETMLQNNKKNKTNNTNVYQIGIEYEKYVLDYITTKYKNCYRWNDIPINTISDKFYINCKICNDIGCDIIGINHDNTIDYIQCKNYSYLGNSDKKAKNLHFSKFIN